MDETTRVICDVLMSRITNCAPFPAVAVIHTPPAMTQIVDMVGTNLASIFLGFMATIALLVILRSMFFVVRQYERGVVFRFGRVRKKVKQPGLRFRLPILDRVKMMDLRIDSTEIDDQAMITRDSIPLNVDAVVFYRVKDPVKAVVEIADYDEAIDQFSLTVLRSVIGAASFDQVLAERDELTGKARIMLDEVTEAWGVEALRVEIKEIGIPEDMERGMAREAEATREKRARIIKAEGEMEAATKLAAAAALIAQSPGAMELRRLQTMQEIGAEHNSTVVLGIPTELLTIADKLARRL